MRFNEIGLLSGNGPRAACLVACRFFIGLYFVVILRKCFYLLANMKAIPPNIQPQNQKTRQDRIRAVVIETTGVTIRAVPEFFGVSGCFSILL